MLYQTESIYQTKRFLIFCDAIHQAGNTVILVTHEEDIAQRAKRVIRLRDGEVESDIRQ